MRLAILQPWIAIEGTANNNAVQSFAHNLDIEPAGSIVPYVEIANFSGTGAHLQLQVSPTPDAGFYMILMDGSGNNASYNSAGVQTLRVFRYSDAQTLPARYLRWNAVGGSTAWSMTFRIFLGVHDFGKGARSAAIKRGDASLPK